MKRRSSPWRLASKVGDRAPRTTIDPLLRVLCHQGEKAISVVVPEAGPPAAHFGTPADASGWLAWRVDGVSLYLSGPLPATVVLTLEGGGSVGVSCGWPSEDGPES